MHTSGKIGTDVNDIKGHLTIKNLFIRFAKITRLIIRNQHRIGAWSARTTGAGNDRHQGPRLPGLRFGQYRPVLAW